MKIVSISLDPRILDPQSRVSIRNVLYGEVVEEYRVLVPSQKDSVSERQNSVTVYGVGGINKFMKLVKILKIIRSLIKENKCDVIASSDPYFIGFGSLLLAKRYKVGFELQILGIEKFTGIRKVLASYVARQAGSVRVNSTHLKERVMDEFSLDIHQVLFVPTHYTSANIGLEGLLPGSTESDQLISYLNRFNSEYEQIYNLLTVGRLVASKNVSLQLKALSALKTENVHIHIVGTGPLDDSLRKEADSLGVTQQVTFHGAVDGFELGALYTACDAFVITSDVDGWPMVLFDAIVAKLPIIMTNAGCAGEMIKDGVNGIVIEVGDSGALASAIKKLKNDTALDQQLTKTATVHFENYWSLDRILAGYKQSWDAAIAATKK